MGAPDDLHPTLQELMAALPVIREAPRERGVLELVVRRPRTGEREVLEEGVLDLVEGLVGDNWLARGNRRTPDRRAHPEMQLNVMSARAVAAVARSRERWALAGDQLFIDMDLSVASLPVGARLALGSAIIEVTPQPHNGCKKFAARFGPDAMKFVNSKEGKALRLRGLNAKVIQPGTVRPGDAVRRVGGAPGP